MVGTTLHGCLINDNNWHVLLASHSLIYTSLLLQLRKISDLNDMFANEMVDIMGVVDTVGDSSLIQTKDGRDVS